MILGIGTDLIDIRRVEKVYNRFGERFLKRCFTDIEQAKANRRKGANTHIDTLAKRFAAKEAMSKALGTGFSQGVFHKDMGVENNALGQPSFVLTGGAQKRLEVMIPENMIANLHITLTDEPPLAKAIVIIEAMAKH